MPPEDSSYDYIVVGAGSAGCVLASRLSEDPHMRVLVLEAGGPDSSFLVHMPKGIGKLVTDPNHAWHYPIDQPREPGGTTSEVWVRGKVLGGSSSINGMIYVRGHPDDYDAWQALGADGWNWSVMKRAFRAIEHHELGEDEQRGGAGPLHVSTGKFKYPLAEALIEAGEQMGLPRKQDLNRDDQEGVGYYAHTIKAGRRQSAAAAFLHPAMRRPNLHVVTGVEVDRLVFDGRQVVGVAARRGTNPVVYRSRGEVIIAAGALNSPRLLLLSGIGPAAALRGLGIEVAVDSPDVGSRMREHLGFAIPYRLKQGKGTNHRFHGIGLALSSLQYALSRTGPLATGPFEVGAFVRTGPHAARPDAQLYLAGLTFARGVDNAPVPLADVERQPGATIYGQLLRLTSEGRITLRSADPAVPMSITPNWLSTPEDCRSAIAMTRYMRRYMAQPALKDMVGEELLPGAAVQSDADILAAFRRFSTCGLHAVATCRMGRDNAAVVDPRLRVIGVSGLRVVDCSVMPAPVSGNTNGPAMALAWHAADLVIEDRQRPSALLA